MPLNQRIKFYPILFSKVLENFLWVYLIWFLCFFLRSNQTVITIFFPCFVFFYTFISVRIVCSFLCFFISEIERGPDFLAASGDEMRKRRLAWMSDVDEWRRLGWVMRRHDGMHRVIQYTHLHRSIPPVSWISLLCCPPPMKALPARLISSHILAQKLKPPGRRSKSRRTRRRRRCRCARRQPKPPAIVSCPLPPENCKGKKKTPAHSGGLRLARCVPPAYAFEFDPMNTTSVAVGSFSPFFPPFSLVLIPVGKWFPGTRGAPWLGGAWWGGALGPGVNVGGGGTRVGIPRAVVLFMSKLLRGGRFRGWLAAGTRAHSASWTVGNWRDFFRARFFLFLYILDQMEWFELEKGFYFVCLFVCMRIDLRT